MQGPSKFQANIFKLSGNSITVEYSNVGVVGPMLVYKDDQIDRTFRGGELGLIETRLGNLITVTLIESPDFEVVTFTLVLPGIMLSEQNVPIDVNELVGITLTERTTIGGPEPGQNSFYSPVTLRGTGVSVAR